MSSYFKRYMNGEHKSVWDEIYLLGEKAYETKHIEDISAVITETMLRVRYNVDILHHKLLDLGYKFLEDLESARTLPDSNTEQHLSLIDNSISSMGYLPLALKEYYRIVGGVNFIWDYDNFPEEMWFEYADPLYIISLRYLLEDTCREDWKEEMESNISDGYSPSAYLVFAPDFYHKDNVSGGQAYSIEVTNPRSIDSKILFEENNITFIEYLRRCFEWGGFPRVAVANKGFEERISYLKNGLKQI